MRKIWICGAKGQIGQAINEIIDKLEIMKELGYPVLLGTSRKSVIGLTLDLPVEEREEGTIWILQTQMRFYVLGK